MTRWIRLVVFILVLCAAGCSSGLSSTGNSSGPSGGYPSPVMRAEISEEEARRLAAEYGLEEGVAPWRVSRYGYSWAVENTLHVEPNRERGGKIMYIDLFTGELLDTLGWAEAF